VLYVKHAMESKLRKINLLRDFYVENTTQEKYFEKIANEIYRELFDSDGNYEHLELKTDSFLRAKRVYDVIIPLFPREVEEFSETFHNTQIRKIQLENLKKIKAKDSQERQKINKLINQYEREIRKNNEQIRNTVRLVDELNKQKSDKVLIPEHISSTNIIDSPDLGYEQILSRMSHDNIRQISPKFNEGSIWRLNLDRLFFTDSEIIKILEKYDLDEFANPKYNLGISMYRTLCRPPLSYMIQRR
jgi:hypothetical protein